MTKTMSMRVKGIFYLTASLLLAFYHTFYQVSGINAKLNAIAAHASTFSDHVAGIGGVIALLFPYLVALVLFVIGLVALNRD